MTNKQRIVDELLTLARSFIGNSKPSLVPLAAFGFLRALNEDTENDIFLLECAQGFLDEQGVDNAAL